MAALYTRKADRRKFAQAAAAKLFVEQPANAYSRTHEKGAGHGGKKKGNSNA